MAKTAAISSVHVTFEAKAVSCAVEAWQDGKWAKAAEILAGAPRRNVVRFDPVKTDRVRLVSSLGGSIVCEIRVYE